MRSELAELLTRSEELSEHDIDLTVQLCWELVQSHWSATHRQFAEMDEQALAAAERCSLGRQNFRTAYEIQFIWQMGLWRVVALVDGILSQRDSALAGKPLQAKLTVLEKEGRVDATAVAQIREWIRLRNVFSHRPVEGPSFAHQLEHADLQEVARLARQVLEGGSASRQREADA